MILHNNIVIAEDGILKDGITAMWFWDFEYINNK